jgi:PAS domain S-box-containing protein
MGPDLDLYGRHKDGTEFPIDLSLSSWEAAEETLDCSFIRDITERKRAETAASHLASIVEGSEDAIIAKTLDGTIVSWNSGAERLYGYQAEEVVGRSLSVLIPTGQPDELPRLMEALRRGESIEHYETTRLHKDGHLVEVSVTISPLRDRAGAVIGASAIARDITQRKRAEEALRESEERFRVALQNAPVVVFQQDRQLRYTWINSPGLAWAERGYLGRTDAEIVGGDEGARLTAIKQEAVRSGLGTRTEVQVTFRGETHYFDLVVEPLRDPRGTLQGLTCSASDITPIKRSLLERERLVARLQQALEEVKLLSGLLSICASCKRIRDERGGWQQMEVYIQSHSQAKFSHGVCPDCLRKLYPEYDPESGKQLPDEHDTAPAKQVGGGS